MILVNTKEEVPTPSVPAGASPDPFAGPSVLVGASPDPSPSAVASGSKRPMNLQERIAKARSKL